MAPTTTKTTSRSKCKICGDKLLQSGNYKVKIKPAKKIPVKAIKLFGDPTKIAGNPADPNRLELDKSFCGLNKFHTYLKKKFLHPAARSNALIITCKNCSSKSTIPLIKRQGQGDKSKYPSSSSTPATTPSLSLFDSSAGHSSSSSTIFDVKSSRKNAKKGKKAASRDLHAGLKIPPSLLKSTLSSTSSASTLSSKEKSKFDNVTPLPSPASKSSPSPGQKKKSSTGPSSSGSSSSISMDKVKLKKGKKEDTDGLRRALFFNSLSKDQKK